jgi:hypothetical protein
MSQQVKKKFIDPSLIQQIDITEQGLAQEILDRQSGDQGLQDQVDTKASQADLDAEALARSNADQTLQDQVDTKASQADLDAEVLARSNADQALQDQLDFITSNTDPAAIDSLTEIVTAFQAADDDLNGAISNLSNTLSGRLDVVEGDIESLEQTDVSLDQRISALEGIEEVQEYEDVASFPVEGEVETIYVAKDDNRIYRYEEGQIGELELPVAPSKSPMPASEDADFTVSPSDDVQAIINSAPAGSKIAFNAGFYGFNQNLVIDKPLTLYGLGASAGATHLSDNRSNSQSFITVSADDVTFHNMLIDHSTSDPNIGHAVVVSGGGFPQARLNNFRMYDCWIRYSKGALSIRSDNFVVESTRMEIFAGSGTRRGILHYGNGGDSFIKNCVFANPVSATLRAICPTSTTGSNPSDEQSGSLTIEGSTFEGLLSQFINMDNHQGQAGDFELIVKNNVTPESNAFLVSFGAVANFGDLFSRIVLIENNLTNNHSSGLGKGVLAIDGFNGPLSYRSSALPVIAIDNVLGQLDFRAGYAEADGSTGSIVGYNTTQITEPTVSLSDSLIVEGSGQYIELSEKADLTQLQNDVSTLQSDVSQLSSQFDAAIISVNESFEAVDEDILAKWSKEGDDLQTQGKVGSKNDQDVVFIRNDEAYMALSTDDAENKYVAFGQDIEIFNKMMKFVDPSEQIKAALSLYEANSQFGLKLESDQDIRLESNMVMKERITLFADDQFFGLVATQNLEGIIRSANIVNPVGESVSSKDMIFRTGNVSRVGGSPDPVLGNSGNVIIRSGNVDSGQSGNVAIFAGSASPEGTRGQVLIGSEMVMNDNVISSLSDPSNDQDAVNLRTLQSAIQDAINDVSDAAVQIFHKKTIVIDTELGFVDLDHIAIENSIIAFVDRLAVHKDADFEVSVVSGKTRLTWIGSLANPDGEEKIETGDKVYVTYTYSPSLQPE